MPGTCVGYVRVSGMGQITGDGFPRQCETIEKYASANTLALVAVFMDAGVSGTKELEEREGLAALMDYVQANGVRIVLIEKSDRLARQLMIGEVILSEFR